MEYIVIGGALAVGIFSLISSVNTLQKQVQLMNLKLDRIAKQVGAEEPNIDNEQEDFYLKWCRDEIGRRVDAIVSNQHRGSYHKAAGLLVAMAETLADRGEKQDGMGFIEKYKNKYSRHTAFKREVACAVQASGLSVRA
jgi:hypothetical protein